MEEIDEGYKILAYIDDLEDVYRVAGKRNLSEALLRDINSLRQDIAELEPVLSTENAYGYFDAEVEGLIDGLMENCREGDEKSISNMVEEIQKRVTASRIRFGLGKARSLINGNGFTLISTADEKGTANTAFAGSATIIDDERMAVIQLGLGKTIENLNHNKNATVIGFKINKENPMATEIARVYLTLIGDEDSGSLFEQMKEGLKRQAGESVAGMMQRVCVFKIEDIRISIPPTM